MNTNLIPDLPFKFKFDSEQTWTVVSVGFDNSGWVMYDIIRDYDEARCTVSAVTLLTKLRHGDWKIIKEEKNMRKINSTSLKGFIATEHQPYTDYSKEIADWLTENADRVDFTRHINPNCYIFTARNGEFYSHYQQMSYDVYYTNEEFKEWIGMSKKPTTKDKLASILNVEGQRALDYLKEKYMNKMPKLVAGKHWVVVENEGYGGIGLITINNMIHYIKGEDGEASHGFDVVKDVSEYIVEVREIADDTPPTFRYAKTVWKKVDQKQLAIQKELEFAKAKAERLAAHISVLETKLK